MTTAKLMSYHFSCGNSSKGPIGFCARVQATSKKEALEILKRVLPDEMKVHPIWQGGEQGKKDDAAIEYIEAYISPDNIKLTSIDEVNEA